mgnify:CR=1 FL=1
MGVSSTWIKLDCRWLLEDFSRLLFLLICHEEVSVLSILLFLFVYFPRITILTEGQFSKEALLLLQASGRSRLDHFVFLLFLRQCHEHFFEKLNAHVGAIDF